ncbi:uncharacterized protein GVI51_J07953 [Nakaseomyces glabratus]|uniref:SEC14 homolog 3 n=2 Tax=Candida glabrata TaxID=5478 RepID=Q6FNY5_CANGA|nr:uncharacterized protein CAGL0J08074g [Nakaseomyces glabratus]KAH7583667.1 CRAL/TRIO, N-terminal domain [Nakaseomyces glabratus]KAH7584157.1 CRAL/TRIO, N-terminal domain [Nakaseomyces glabratus]KAH7585400.1 CRAL/TRIO, N-terminal domain [Nakaseomyces glabratus]KAH7597901.1 CRAL/TRIO, N-terminal domain [Nakaseomyces glabratus]KAH7598479.1 CRAL/TRIO, N-terminal domain [Nakaseomyces glabratus]|eukprot:XP_448059.1 uncharacterized protein CAGL0J08074g [[Candida] glabrata]
MGIFSRKKKEATPVNRGDLIPCETMIEAPPKGSPPPKKPADLDAEQTKKLAQMLEHFNKPDLVLPVSSTDDTGKTRPISSWEKFFLTRDCFLRYLRAQKWDVPKAIKMLTETLVWRREVGITHGEEDEHPLKPEDIAVENETGKEILLGFDYDRRPLFYMKNGRQNTESSFRQVQQMLFMMECATTLTPQGVEKMCVLVDFKHYKEPGIITDKAPPISIAKMCLHIMQNHYPERLGKCILINIPWFIWAFLKMMYNFLDPATKEKVIFDEPFTNHIDPSQLEATYDGRLDFKYNHAVYWPDMNAKIEAIRNKQYERFQKFGAVMGLSEWDLKGDHDELVYPVDSIKA